MLLMLAICLCGLLASAQPPEYSYIRGKIKYQFNFEAKKFDSLYVELKQGDSLVAKTWARKMKFSFDMVKAGEYEVWVKIPKSQKYEQDGIVIRQGRDGFALPAYPELEIFEVNMDGLEPDEADRVRKAQVKFEKQQLKKAD